VTTVSAGADAQPVSAGSDRLPDMEFAEFFRAEHKKLIRFVTTMGANSDQAAEIAPETFFKARHCGNWPACSRNASNCTTC
jgi:DNA-directed RNA polymerase specialized sigma24 family protein